LDGRLTAIRDGVMRTLQGLPPNPLHEVPVDEVALERYQEVDISDDNVEE
jgi:hypothetical protein